MMASVTEDLIAFLLSDADVTHLVGQRVHANHVPEKSSYPHIWLARSGKEKDRDLDGQGGITRHLFDLECISPDLGDAQDVADAVDDRLAGHRGTFGTRRVQGVFLDDQDDDYIPRGTGGDDGLMVVAQQVTIWST